MKSYYVPEFGSRDEKAEVAEISCAVGDVFAQDQELMVLTTDKAAFALEAEETGRVAEIVVAQGDKVGTGDPLLHFQPMAS